MRTLMLSLVAALCTGPALAQTTFCEGSAFGGIGSMSCRTSPPVTLPATSSSGYTPPPCPSDLGYKGTRESLVRSMGEDIVHDLEARWAPQCEALKKLGYR